jgi:ATP-dependent DNA ligase
VAWSADPNWLHEIKHDGFRIMTRLNAARVRLFTRNRTISQSAFPWSWRSCSIMLTHYCAPA